MPNGRLKAKPPAKGAPPGAVWQAWQSAAWVEIFAALHEIGAGKLGGNAGDIAALVIRQRHGRAAGEGHGITAKKQPARETERDNDNDRDDNADDFFHVHADLAAAFLIARRMRI